MKGTIIMKRKKLIRAFLILLCAALLCSIPAYAVEARASERIDLSASTIGKTASGDLSAYFMVRATEKMDVIGATSVEIQRYTFTGWVTEYTFTSEKIPALLKTDSTRNSAELIYTPLFPGKTYRSVANIYVKNATGTTTQRLPSNPVT